MLEGLRPAGAHSDDELDHDHDHVYGVDDSERPQFILGDEIETESDKKDKEKAEVEHDEGNTSAFNNAQTAEEGRGKGWKEAAV
jgi:hypothetical protein